MDSPSPRPAAPPSSFRVVVDDVINVHHDAYMAKDAVLTVRVPLELKRRLERRAEREHRSASAQAVYELERALALESTASTGRRRQALGMVAAKKLPTEEDFAEVRARLWGRLGARDG